MTFSFSKILCACAVCCLLAACTTQDTRQLWLQQASYDDLPGWPDMAAVEVMPALSKSCTRIAKKAPDATFSPHVSWAGTAKLWQEACAQVDAAHPADFFAKHFIPWRIYGPDGGEGLFTGYYVPLLHGSREKKGRYQTPLYARPAQMFTANLGDFHPDLKGRKLTARVDGTQLKPFWTRTEIENGAIKDAEKVIWVDDPVDAFFLHIQGSGQVQMEDGSRITVGYAAQNGHSYTAIGRTLIRQGEVSRENMSMQTIRDWLNRNPDKAADLMNTNDSFIFFRILDGDNVLGAEGLPLTPHRSLAVDKKLFPFGVPMFVDAAHPEDDMPRLQRLMVAQDTGGAIKGAVRGDVFWGAGEDAARLAGQMKSRGSAWVLLPRDLDIPEDKIWHWWHGVHGAAQKESVYNP